MRPILSLVICTCFLLCIHVVAGQCCKNLVLDCAGIKRIAYAGAIRYLEEKEMIGNIEKVGGTSAGAIAALAVALGYDSKEKNLGK
ncbi:MAG: patatin-like phospholipase family protein [Cyclobacteriaceae bacterium]